jgi:predicted DNA-binding transcriptional regulator AlpA
MHDKPSTLTRTQVMPQRSAGHKDRTMNEITPELLNVKQTAALTGVSWRSVYRQCDAGRFPQPVRIGSRSLWRRTELLDWITQGCPPVRSRKGGAV